MRTYIQSLETAFGFIVMGAKIGLTITLFLIGTSLSRQMLRGVDIRPLAHALSLWVVISAGSLFAVYTLLG